MRLSIYILAIINFMIGRKISNSILHPIRLFGLFWTLLIIIPISWWNIGYRWDGSGLLWIEIAVLFTQLGAIFAHSKYQQRIIVVERKLKTDFEYNWKILYIIIGLAFLGVVLTVSVNGFKLSDFSSFSGLLSVSSEMTQRRYFTGEQTSTLQKIVSIFGSTAVLCGGYSFNYARDKFHKRICFITFVPVILTVLLTTAKSGMISSVILFLAGWGVSKIRLTGKLPTVAPKVILVLGSSFAGLLAFLYFAMLLRVGDFSADMRNIISNKFFIYAFGEMVEFDGWFSDQKEFSLYQLGINTYMTVPRVFGLVNRLQGVYSPYVYGYGNVFTVFRGIISDYGVVGGILYCLLRGLITEYCCLIVGINERNNYICMVLIACQYFFGLYGFIVSPWIYTTYVLAMLTFLMFLLLFDRRLIFGKKGL